MLDFRIKSFLAVYAEKGFSRAAERLHLTQPAVSRHIKELEERFGVPLFERRGRSLKLSEAGALLHRFATVAEADGERTEALIRERRTRLPLRFGATRTIGEYVLPELVGAYLEDRPDAELSMRVENTEALLASLRDGAIDFAFIEGIFDRASYETRLFFADRFIPVCAPDDPLAERPRAAEELLVRRLIVREEGSGSRLILERELQGRNRRIDNFSGMLELGNIEAMKRLVARGIGIAFLYEASVAKEIADGTLAEIPLNDFSVTHDYSFAFLKGGIYGERYLEFLTFCRAHAAGGRA